MSAEISDPSVVSRNGAAVIDDDRQRMTVHFLNRNGELLYSKDVRPDGGWAKRIFKAEGNEKATPEGGDPSRQGSLLGQRNHPFDFKAVVSFKNSNVHHSTCIETKKECTVGLGFKSDKVGMILDPLSGGSFLNVMTPVSEDFWQTGNGLVEVVRRDNKISGLHYLTCQDAYVNVENEKYDYHYDIQGSLSSGSSGLTRKFARFGDLERFLKAHPGIDVNSVSEVIHFKRASSLSRWYGFPDWLSAVAAIELSLCLHQYKFDFFNNRGVPEFMLFVMGGNLEKDDWADIKKAVQANIGQGNSHKSMAINIPSAGVTVQLEKLGLDGSKDAEEFATTNDSLALEIVSAHRVPPLLAGIQIPGKLGASNEMTNALLAFHMLVCAQAQRNFQTTLASTLGNKVFAPDIGLVNADFELNNIVDSMFEKLAQPGAMALNTVGGMRQGVAEAGAQGRDLSAGLKKADETWAAIQERIAKMNDAQFGDMVGNAMGTLLSMRMLRGVAA